MDDTRDLKLKLTLDAPRDKVWRCWTETGLLRRWFTPEPWSTVDADLDPRPGGRMNVTMRSPEGAEMPNTGVFLEVVPGERLVTTDAYSEGWLPSGKPFMTTILSLADAGPGKTAYRVVVRHWTAEDREAHEKMGFQDGWTTAARQLEALAQTL
jgi:uncharacterized protein YndB with AHSA1/START domain